jgi:hypothetical protein
LRTFAFGKLLLCGLVLPLVACGKSKAEEPAPFEEDLDGGFGGSSSSSGGLGKDGGATSLPECAEETTDIFVISEENSLYSFHPPTLAF